MSKNKASRRVILKAVASFPLAFTFGLPLSAKEFKKSANVVAKTQPVPDTAGGLPASSVLPASTGKPFAQTVRAEDQIGTEAESLNRPIAKFSENAFPDAWSYVSFEVTREGKPMPGYLLKLPDGNFVAYSVTGDEFDCKLRLFTDKKAVFDQCGIVVSQPVLACSCHGSAFSLDPVAKRIAGPERSTPAQLAIRRCHDKICVLA
jgi:hypothetical protein